MARQTPIADLLIKIGADSYEFQNSVKTVEKSIDSFRKKMDSMGKDLSKKLTAPLAAFAGISVKLADTQKQAEAKLLTALKGRVDIQQRLIQQAGELQQKTTLGDETIIEWQGFLASIKLSEEWIKKTTEASIQLSAATGMTMESAVKNLAKTFGGLTGELGESLPALKNFTQEQLKAGAAVDYILQNYKGFAEVKANEGVGPLIQLKNAWGDFMEQVGTIILPYLQRLAKWLKSLVEFLQNLSPEVKKTIVVLGGLAAAIGPILLTLGSIVKTLPLLASGFSALLNPITLVVAAVGALAAAWAYARMKREQYFQDEAAKAIEEREYTTSDIRFIELKNEHLKKQLEEAKNKDTYTPAVNASLGAVAAYQSSKEKIDIDKIKEEIVLNETIISQLKRKKRFEDELRKNTPEPSYKVEGGNNSVKVVSSDALQSIGVEGVSTRDMNDLSFYFDPGKVKKPDYSKYEEEKKKFAEKVVGLHAFINDQLNRLISNGVVSISESLGQIFTGDIGLESIATNIGIQLGNFLKEVGKQLIQTSIQMEAFLNAIKVLAKKPIIGIIVGTAMVAAGSAIVSSLQKRAEDATPKLAKGGLAYGPTYAMIGDNPNAGIDPEVVAPLSKLRNMMGVNSKEFNINIGGVFRIKGSDLELALSKNNMRSKLVNG